MHFPADHDTDTFAWQGRKIYMGPATQGGEVLTLSAGASETVFERRDDLATRALNDPVLTYEGRLVQRMSREDAETYIPIVEQRLSSNATLLEELKAKLAAKQKQVDDNQAALDAAYAAVKRLVKDDRIWVEARAGQRWQGTGMIVQTIDVVTPNAFIQHRQKWLADCVEWKRFAQLESRVKSRTSTEALAIQELGDLTLQLAEERKMTSKLESRLFDLHENVRWWQREAAELLGETA